MSKTALVLLVPGAEEMEFVVAVDVLRRAGVCKKKNTEHKANNNTKYIDLDHNHRC